MNNVIQLIKSNKNMTPQEKIELLLTIEEEKKERKQPMNITNDLEFSLTLSLVIATLAAKTIAKIKASDHRVELTTPTMFLKEKQPYIKLKEIESIIVDTADEVIDTLFRNNLS